MYLADDMSNYMNIYCMKILDIKIFEITVIVSFTCNCNIYF